MLLQLDQWIARSLDHIVVAGLVVFAIGVVTITW
jgi:hypothetical protein